MVTTTTGARRLSDAVEVSGGREQPTAARAAIASDAALTTDGLRSQQPSYRLDVARVRGLRGLAREAVEVGTGLVTAAVIEEEGPEVVEGVVVARVELQRAPPVEDRLVRASLPRGEDAERRVGA